LSGPPAVRSGDLFRGRAMETPKDLCGWTRSFGPARGLPRGRLSSGAGTPLLEAHFGSGGGRESNPLAEAVPATNSRRLGATPLVRGAFGSGGERNTVTTPTRRARAYRFTRSWGGEPEAHAPVNSSLSHGPSGPFSRRPCLREAPFRHPPTPLSSPITSLAIAFPSWGTCR
jgi:hypothetical protein